MEVVFSQNWDFTKMFGRLNSAPGLNRGLSSNFSWLRSANHVKFTEECDINGECFSQKNLYKLGKHGSSMINRRQKDGSLSGNTFFPVKEKFWVQQSVKKVMLTVFWDMKVPHY